MLEVWVLSLDAGCWILWASVPWASPDLSANWTEIKLALSLYLVSHWPSMAYCLWRSILDNRAIQSKFHLLPKGVMWKPLMSIFGIIIIIQHRIKKFRSTVLIIQERTTYFTISRWMTSGQGLNSLKYGKKNLEHWPHWPTWYYIASSATLRCPLKIWALEKVKKVTFWDKKFYSYKKCMYLSTFWFQIILRIYFTLSPF